MRRGPPCVAGLPDVCRGARPRGVRCRPAAGGLAVEPVDEAACQVELGSDTPQDLALWLWEYFEIIQHAPYERVLAQRALPGARWFPAARLNYAEHAFGKPEDVDQPAVLAYSQARETRELTFGELHEQVRRTRSGLQRLGVGRGDVVVGYLPNIPETLVAFLATASLGAIWAACAPEFCVSSVVDRFAQVEPTVMLAVDGYTYGKKQVDRRLEVTEIRAALPSVQHVVHVPFGGHDVPDATAWDDLCAATDALLDFEPVPFDHPLYVLFSSGTTGKPKAIIHGHGGILLEHLKSHAFHWDLQAGDRLLSFTTTSWMMWNAMASALLVRASMVMIDGDPMHPDLGYQWRLAEETGATLMGLSPAYLQACRKAEIDPSEYDLSKVRQYGVVGSPLSLDGYAWVADHLGTGAILNVGSGGTDVCTGLVQGGPMQPVWAGEMSGASLGVDVLAFDPDGNAVVGELGELVVTAPMPSMPVGFWGDGDGGRYRAAYFAEYPGIWRHGDWIRSSPNGSCVITGRSDATLNRGGVRLGTAEFYGVVDALDEVRDSLVVHLEDPDGGQGELLLFVTLREGAELDDTLRTQIAVALRSGLSPRHMPDEIVQVPVTPHNRTGKKLEVPVKRLLQGKSVEEVASLGALAEPDSLAPFVQYAERRALANGQPLGR